MLQGITKLLGQARTGISTGWPATLVALLEAVFWTCGYLLAQAIVLVGVMVLFLTSAYGVAWPDAEGIIKLILDLELDRSFLLIGVCSIGALLLILPSVRLREGKAFRERIGWRRPTRQETIYSLATVIPIAILGDLLYGATSSWWLSVEPGWPFGAAIREASLDQIYRASEGVSFPVLIVALALAPAVGEELVFRGLIGRRMIRHLGVPLGVLFSSIFFAVAHGSPAHAIATLPVGILLHLLYLETGTIWVPVLVHACNNMLAISMVRFQLAQQAPVPGMLVAALTLHLIAILALLHSRSTQLHRAAKAA